MSRAARLARWAGDAGAVGWRQGTLRQRAPTETLARLRPLLPLLGITRVADVTGLDRIGVPVFLAVRPNARSLSVSQGKGLTPDLARVSAIMEALELWHAERIALPVRLASWREMTASGPVADVAALPRTARLAPGRRLHWVAGHDLVADRPRWLPFEVVHMDATLPPLSDAGVFVASSSGLASGNHRLEATLHALCELIERDAATLWHLKGRAADTRLDLDSVDDDACRTVLEHLDAAAMAVGAWDIASDVGIPAFDVQIADRDATALRTLYVTRGLGCHPSRAVALLRALTEAIQSRLTFIAGSRDDLTHAEYRRVRDLDAIRRFAADRGPCPRRFADVADYRFDDFATAVAHVLERLEAVGIGQVLVVDLTRPDLRIPVVRAAVPGLEAWHQLPGWTPGRRARA